MTTIDWLRLTLAEIETAPSEIERQWRINAARTYARMIASRLDETRTAEKVLRDAMTEGRKAA